MYGSYEYVQIAKNPPFKRRDRLASQQNWKGSLIIEVNFLSGSFVSTLSFGNK